VLKNLGPLLTILEVYLAILYLAIAYWALKDARSRSDSVGLHYFALFINLLVPLLGLLVYLLVRPGSTLVERRALELEAEALTPTTEVGGDVRPCPACGREIERDFVLCPYCNTRFAKRCPSCHKAVRLGWTLCPYCAENLEISPVSRAAGQQG
jgi:RNA polymerase subunit RPABC4/transcription elongation factor Spt4